MRLPFLRSDERRLEMVWTIEHDAQRIALVGTAHFFPYRFTRSLGTLIEKVDRVIFEGPLDDASLDRIRAHGRDGGSTPRLVDHLDPRAVKRICRILNGRLDRWTGRRPIILPPAPGRECFEWYAQGMRPWMTLFTIWSSCLEWDHSVDAEAHAIARRLGKRICPLETVEEQLEVLDGISWDRIVNQLNDVRHWPEIADRYVKGYLAGDLSALRFWGRRFDAGPRPLVSDRDRILFERMVETLEGADGVAFVGFPHVPGIGHLFRERGAQIRQGLE